MGCGKTDKEIIKALECCTTNGASCKDCPAFVKVDRSNCKKYFRGALDLINRLEKENEELKEACERIAEDWSEVTIEKDKLFDEAEATINKYKAENERLTHITRNLIGEIKAEAYAEFAERLKTEYAKGMNWFKKKESYYVDVGDIDNLLKELEGEDK